jgi:hypothetical protein
MTTSTNELLRQLAERIRELEHQAELIRTVLIVKEPNSIPAADAYEGLRKQIVAAAAERRSHLNQLVAMAVAVRRARSLDDLVPQLREWMQQAGVGTLIAPPDGDQAGNWFEDLTGEGLDGPIEIVEPAFFDLQTGAPLRLGRARRDAGPGDDRQDRGGAADGVVDTAEGAPA